MSRALEAATDDGKTVLDWDWWTTELYVVIEVRSSLVAMAVGISVEKLARPRLALSLDC
jgi:hypothetical protein